ncbi:hypothetical protein ACDX78_13540 [Virgibacillus oceani]
MIIAFQIILLISIMISAAGMVGEREDMNLRNSLTAFGIVSIAAFVVSVLYL